MRLKIIEALIDTLSESRERLFYLDSRGLSLGQIFREAADEVDAVSVNGRFLSDWQSYTPEPADSVDVFAGPGWAVIVPLLISLALSALSMLIFPQPKRPKPAGHQPAFGVPGVSNTLTPGMPKLMVFGTRRYFPGIIGSQGRVIDGGRRMSFKALYFCGVGPIGSLGGVLLDEVPLEDIPDTSYQVRLGTDDQTVIPGWEHCHQLYQDNQRTIAIGNREAREPGRPIFYRTKSRAVDRLTFFLAFPSGIFGVRTTGSRAGTMHNGYYIISIRARALGDTEFLPVVASIDGGALAQSPFFLTDRTQQPLFKEIVYEVPARGVYDIEFQLLEIRWDSQQSADPVLLSVQETLYLTTSYPGQALLSVEGIGSEQITSLENLKTSVLACGMLVEDLSPPPPGEVTLAHSSVFEPEVRTAMGSFVGGNYEDIAHGSGIVEIPASFFTAGKKYLIKASALIGTNSGLTYRVRVVHGTDIIGYEKFPDGELLHRSNGVAPPSGPWQQFGWFGVWTAAAGEKVKLQLGGPQLNTAYITQIHLSAEKLSDDLIEGVDWFYAEHTTPTALTTTPQDGAAITFTPAHTSDWLVMSLAFTDPGSGSTADSSASQLLHVGDSDTPAAILETVIASQTVIKPVARVYELGASSQTFKEQAFTTGSSGVHVRERSKIFALNLSRFKAHVAVFTASSLNLGTTSFGNELVAANLELLSAGPVSVGFWWGFDVGDSQRSAYQRLLLNNTDLPSGQTAAGGHGIRLGFDSRDENPMLRFALANVNAGTHALKLEAHVDSTTETPAAKMRSLWAYSLRLA